jgi:hypothetical protein
MHACMEAAGCPTDRVGELAPPDLGPQRRRVWACLHGEQAPLRGLDAQVVARLGVEQPNRGAHRADELKLRRGARQRLVVQADADARQDGELLQTEG